MCSNMSTLIQLIEKQQLTNSERHAIIKMMWSLVINYVILQRYKKTKNMAVGDVFTK